MKKNILIFPCGSEIGLEIERSLKHSTHFNVYGASSVNNHGEFVFENYISGLPYIDDETFISKLNEIIKENRIDFIFPAHDSVLLKLSFNRSKLNAELITSCAETCVICCSKKKTYEYFENIIRVPHLYRKNESLAFPVFLKPNVGQGSKGTYKANSQIDVDFYLKKDNSLLVMEYLPGKEYTIDCFTDRFGKLLFSKGRERSRISNGISVNSYLVENYKFTELAKKINSSLSFQGAWFFQVKENINQELVLMEIAPRIAGTMALFRGAGINFSQLSLFDKLGYDVEVFINDFDIKIDKAWSAKYKTNIKYSTIYIDFDDTIIVDNKVNTDIVKFLYQATNENKKIILISKHCEDIMKTLNKFKINSDIFSEIICLSKDKNKEDFIKEKNAIFIDDSFSERLDVFKQTKIPVFGIDAIEVLLN